MNLSILYNKQMEQEPIKNGHYIVTCKIDFRNNVYTAIGEEIHIYSLQRLGSGKDYLIQVINMKNILKAYQSIRSKDELTNYFNLKENAECLQFTFQNSQNKFISPSYVSQRYKYLNQKNPKIIELSISLNYCKNPKICVLLNDKTLVLLKKDKSNEYEVEKYWQNIKIGKYLSNNHFVKATENQLVILDHTYQTPLFKLSLTQNILKIQALEIHQDLIIYVLLFIDSIRILTLNKFKIINQKSFPLNEFCDYLSISSEQKCIYFGSAMSIYRIDTNGTDSTITKVKDLDGEKILLIKKQIPYTSTNFREKSLTRALCFTTNSLIVSFNSDNGTNYKQANLLISNPDCYQIIKNSLEYMSKMRSKQLPINFYDIRILRKKSLLSEILQILLMLYDSKFVNSLKNIKERKINNIIMSRAMENLASLNILEQKIYIQKLLIILLIFSDVNIKNLLDQLINNTIKAFIENKYSKSVEINPITIHNRCIFTLNPLSDHPLVKCKQCKKYGIDQFQQQFKKEIPVICYICWGQLKQIDL